MAKASIPWNGNQIYKSVVNGSLTFDNAIQRNEVWDIERKSKFIDTLIRGYIVLPLVTVRTNETVTTKKGKVSVYDCIDGKQRCTTLVHFMNDEFALKGVKPIMQEDGTELDINGLKFSELDEDMQDDIKSFGFTVYYLSDVTDDEISEIMSRLNNGKSLTGIEIARIKSLCLHSVIELAKHPLLMENLTETAIRGYANEDIVMKSLLLMEGNTDLSSKNVRTAYENIDLTAEHGKELSEALSNAMTLVNDAVAVIKEKVQNKEIKKKVLTKILSKTNLISIIYVTSCMDALAPDALADKLAEFFAPTDAQTINSFYNDACTNGTMHSGNVEARNRTLKLFLENGEA